jgi:RsiW-degrading membrane proteinase PrsW (M82 family)
MMLPIYIFISLFISWVWVDYYRLIDLYHRNDLKYFIGTFLIGCFSVFPVFAIQEYIFDPLHIELTDGLINNVFYNIFAIGLVEELAKLLLFGVAYVLLRSQYAEPIDIIAHICTIALGFAAVENVLYFSTYGAAIVDDRAILSTVLHMICASIIGYGIIRYLYHPKDIKKWSILLFVLLAAAVHGMYDFWLLYKPVQSFGWIVTMVFFLFMISVFAGILNNAANNSTFFTYKKVIDSRKVSKRLLQYYLAIFAMQFFAIVLESNFLNAWLNFGSGIILVGFVVVVSTMRLSRFKLIKNRWNPIRFELPFSYNAIEDYGGRKVQTTMKIRGDSYSEAKVTGFYNEYLRLAPLSPRNSSLKTARLAFIEKKLFLYKDESYFLVRVYGNDQATGNGLFLFLKPKVRGTSFTNRGEPIAALLAIDHLDDYHDPSLKASDFKFIEWVILRPITDELRTQLEHRN